MPNSRFLKFWRKYWVSVIGRPALKHGKKCYYKVNKGQAKTTEQLHFNKLTRKIKKNSQYKNLLINIPYLFLNLSTNLMINHNSL